MGKLKLDPFLMYEIGGVAMTIQTHKKDFIYKKDKITSDIIVNYLLKAEKKYIELEERSRKKNIVKEW